MTGSWSLALDAWQAYLLQLIVEAPLKHTEYCVQLVSCGGSECLRKVFPDSYHLHTLEKVLATCAQAF